MPPFEIDEEKEIEYDKTGEPIDESFLEEDEDWLPEDDVEEDDIDWCDWEDHHSIWGEWP